MPTRNENRQNNGKGNYQAEKDMLPTGIKQEVFITMAESKNSRTVDDPSVREESCWNDSRYHCVPRAQARCKGRHDKDVKHTDRKTKIAKHHMVRRHIITTRTSTALRRTAINDGLVGDMPQQAVRRSSEAVNSTPIRTLRNDGQRSRNEWPIRVQPFYDHDAGNGAEGANANAGVRRTEIHDSLLGDIIRCDDM